MTEQGEARGILHEMVKSVPATSALGRAGGGTILPNAFSRFRPAEGYHISKQLRADLAENYIKTGDERSRVGRLANRRKFLVKAWKAIEAAHNSLDENRYGGPFGKRNGGLNVSPEANPEPDWVGELLEPKRLCCYSCFSNEMHRLFAPAPA